MLGLPHHLSVHPGGVVIAPGPIVDFLPVTRSGGKGIIITQFDLDDVEQVGLVKLDLLGIRGLTVIGDVAESIFSWRRKEFRTPYEILEVVPQQDPETSAIISNGRTIGCFQIESPGMRATLKDVQARSPNDLMAALALYRPGPLKGGLRDAFVRRFKHEEEVAHIHPALSGLLQETYGVILYQEQVLRIAHELAGLSLAEADLLRRAMSHFDPGKQMQVLKEKFIEGAEQRKNIPPEMGLRIWDMMAAFAGYGFPKAHAASYAQVAWQSAWCKAHYPAEFIAAVLANWGGYYPQSVYLNEARRLNINVFSPHVNHSRPQFSVSYPLGEPVLYMGLDQVRDLTHRTQAMILRYRPFHTLTEFIMKVDPRKTEIENLVKIGAFEGLGRIPDLLMGIENGLTKPGQLSLFPPELSVKEDWSLEEKIKAQQHILNASLAGHPLELLLPQIQEAGAISTIDAAARMGETVRVVGLRQTLFRSLTAQNEWMGFLTLEDLEGMIDIVIFPDLYRKVKNILSSSSIPILIEGTIERDANTGEPILTAQKVSRM
ncbi:MAG: DNA polymerase III subunit alpha [Anaerolineaceae bacterium]|nr:DNA polymerase III subunit alpha [Anaerolineaceae bacterium]